MPDHHFATFWHGGELSPMEKACLGSFAARNYSVEIYSFAPLKDLPDGVVSRDAGEIVDAKSIDGFIVEGKPSVSHFSDYFRYKLLHSREAFWIDSDMVCLRPLDRPIPRTLFVLEQPDSLCNAIMRIAPEDPSLPSLIAQAEAMIGKEIAWGATGPRLLTAYYGTETLMRQAEPPSRYFPVHYTEFWKVFHPAFLEECRQLCDDADTLHLWNNLVVRSGIWKKFGPPRGSYLAEAFERVDCLRYFTELYPAEVMARVLENFIARDGADLGLKRLARLVGPSIRNTLRRRVTGDGSSFLHHLPSVSGQLKAAAAPRGA